MARLSPLSSLLLYFLPLCGKKSERPDSNWRLPAPKVKSVRSANGLNPGGFDVSVIVMSCIQCVKCTDFTQLTAVYCGRRLITCLDAKRSSQSPCEQPHLLRLVE